MCLCFCRWLDEGEDDHEIERVLVAGAVPPPRQDSPVKEEEQEEPEQEEPPPGNYTVTHINL